MHNVHIVLHLQVEYVPEDISHEAKIGHYRVFHKIFEAFKISEEEEAEDAKKEEDKEKEQKEKGEKEKEPKEDDDDDDEDKDDEEVYTFLSATELKFRADYNSTPCGVVVVVVVVVGVPVHFKNGITF